MCHSDKRGGGYKPKSLKVNSSKGVVDLSLVLILKSSTAAINSG
jgi:hypothetical protein